ncbi:sensitive to high expression protein 9 [Pholiota molesta]|nr:sensitive to high expression protein 9 [Pholiota molesta]
MLRRPFSRPFLLRQFSTFSPVWNAQRPIQVNTNKEEKATEPQNTHIPPTTVTEDVRTKSPLPTHSDASSSSKPGPSVTPEPLTAYDIDLVKQRIRSWTEQAAIALRNKADDFTASSKATFSQLGSELNRVTGYEEIEVLKREERINAAREASKTAKQALAKAVAQRSDSQREVNDLLSRKSTWDDSDEEARAKVAADETEAAVDKEFSQLLRAILARYHEEQVWSDKIRSASTYGSLAALGLNMLVFIIAIIVVEPWKRRRLAQTFERKIEELSEENEARLAASMQSISQQIVQQATLIESLKEEFVRKTEPASELQPQPYPITGAQEPVSGVNVLSWQVSHRQLEMAAMGAGAFAIGILSSVLLGR